VWGLLKRFKETGRLHDQQKGHAELTPDTMDGDSQTYNIKKQEHKPLFIKFPD
jgi:hypothetical protein